MTKKTKILSAVAIGLLVIQSIRPSGNTGNADGENDITKSVAVPDQVMSILKSACYDCHSNHTDPMWYMNIQPVGWWIQHHINEGKEKLNFSEFNTYTLKRKKHKLEEVAEQVEKGEMPMASYTWMHGEAKLSPEQANVLKQWALESKKSLEEQNDSVRVQ